MNRFLMVVLAFAAVLFVVACGGDGTKEPAIYDTEQSDETPDIDTAWQPDNYTIDCGPSPTGMGGDMCNIPAGEFQMGCNEAVDTQCYGTEKPYHTIYLSAYKIGKYEVTVAEYQQCVTNGACNNSGEHKHYRTNTDKSYCNFGAEGKGNHPMQCVTWYGAKAYCEWIGGRLLTEAEWEKAARGTDGRKYPWGNTPTVSCDHAVMDDDNAGGDGCGTGGTMPVGSNPNGVSPYGAYDMIGNVWEWVNDRYASDYYASSPRNDPTGPESGVTRVLRGGSWSGNLGSHLRASGRYYFGPDLSYAYYVDDGFRCAK